MTNVAPLLERNRAAEPNVIKHDPLRLRPTHFMIAMRPGAQARSGRPRSVALGRA
jgi:hypothetical protein